MADSNLPYFIMGLGVGAAVGLLFAPKPGEETREEIRRRADEGRDYIRRRGGELREQAGDIIEHGREAVGARRDQLNAALDAGRQAYKEATNAESAESPESAAAG